MDTFSLKKDNRKKFQDKQKLKHKHATPSDRKYYNIKKTEEAKQHEKEAEEKKQAKLSNNFERYNEDEDINEQIDSYDSTTDRNKLKQILKDKATFEEEQEANKQRNKDNLTSKDIHTMNINELNNLLGKNSLEPDNHPAVIKQNIDSERDSNQTHITQHSMNTRTANSQPNFVPNNLSEDQEFLDSIL